jgi:hypothetical protein
MDAQLGTRRDEVYHLLPGDELLPEPQIHAARRHHHVLPLRLSWLVQLGQGAAAPQLRLDREHDGTESAPERILPETRILRSATPSPGAG